MVDVRITQNANGGLRFDEDIDPVDVDMRVAVDELLGIRGPLQYLMRNVIVLILFNGLYLGLFAFVPYRSNALLESTFLRCNSIGSSIVASLNDATDLNMATDRCQETTYPNVIVKVGTSLITIVNYLC